MKRTNILLILVAAQILLVLCSVQADAATISGRVTAADESGIDTGVGIAGVEVRAYAVGSEFPALGDDTTDLNGEYEITGLDAGTYIVKFWAVNTGYFSEWYNDKADFGTADPLMVTDPGSITGIDAVLEPSGSISGTVTDESSAPIAGICVFVHGSVTGYLGDATTDSNGDYTVSGLPAGNLKVEFDACGSNYISEWYDDKAGFLTADLVPVTVPNTTAGIDAVLQPIGDELAVDFGASGLYSYDGGWSRLTTGNAQWLGYYSGKLVVDFGASGFYEYNGGAWTRLTPGDADNSGNTMTAFGGGLAADFGASGLYFYNGARWTRLSTGNPQWLASYSGKLAVDFGASGLYEYNGSAWTRLTPGNADNSGNTMAAYAGGLAVDFGASGLYFYNGARWTKISSANVDWLTSYGGMLAADFGAYGLYTYNGAWTRISSGNPDNSGNTMAAYAGGLAVDFGASGLYFYNGAGWTRLSTANPQWLRAYGDKLAVDFGASGMWEYNGSSWTRITTGNADNSGNTMIDW